MASSSEPSPRYLSVQPGFMSAPTSEPDDLRQRDQQRVLAIRNGDEGAFRELFGSSFDQLQAYAERYVGYPDVAEELVGNVFVRIWEHRASLEIRQSLTSYLYAAVRNQALMWLEHQRVVRRTRESALADRTSPGMGEAPAAADATLCADELSRAIESAIELLPGRAKEAFVLSRQHGFTYAEIAQEMGIAQKTVEIHLGRALKFLREKLDAYIG